jgi:hypothetical protein
MFHETTCQKIKCYSGLKETRCRTTAAFKRFNEQSGKIVRTQSYKTFRRLSQHLAQTR